MTPLPGAFRGEKIMNSPGIGDIDDDGALDIVVGTNECYDEPLNVSLSSGTSAAWSPAARRRRAELVQQPRLRDPEGRHEPSAAARSCRAGR